jgi:glutathione S-transferase
MAVSLAHCEMAMHRPVPVQSGLLDPMQFDAGEDELLQPIEAPAKNAHTASRRFRLMRADVAYRAPMIRLVALPYSPWSEKARWALDHHRVAYKESAHMPMLGESLLRLRSGKMSGRVSVPLLVADGQAIDDSFAIARYAEAHGSGTPLFPRGAEGDVEAWNGRSEEALRAARVVYLRRLESDADARRETLPGFLPDALKSVLMPGTVAGVRFVGRKYKDLNPANADAAFEAALAHLEAVLDGKPHLLGDFSFADIAMSTVLQFVQPVADQYLHLGPASRRCATDESLAKRFSRAVSWRDRLYTDHRKN